MFKQFTAIIEREDDGYVALCPELDIASQGSTIEEARVNLLEALEPFLETASPEEIEGRACARRSVQCRSAASHPTPSPSRWR